MSRWTGSATVSVALLGLLAASLIICRRLTSDIGDLRAQLQQLPARPLTLHGAVLMANGIDQSGRILDQMPLGTKRMVVFVLIGADLQANLSVWGAVRRAAPPGTFFLGMCGDAQCASESPSARAGFPILIYGEVSGQVAALQAYRRGEFLVTDDRARILGAPPLRQDWREVVAELEAVR